MTGLRAFVESLVPPGLSFRDPLLLLLLVLVPLAIALKILREKRGDGALVVPTLANVARVRPTWRVRFRLLPFALALIGYSGLVVALARPRLGLERTESWTEGVDIFIALDASGSMAAEDFTPKNRFFVAKSCARQFIEGRSSDRVGLLVFAGRSRTVSPLTTDRGMVLDRLAGLKLGDQGDGTAIGLALGNALARLRPSKAKSRVVVLVTDGGNNAGEIDPDTAALVAKALGVRVAIDDFGTGYASLSHLQRLPVDILKIDMSFVAALNKYPGWSHELLHASELLQAILGVGQALSLAVIAEGIEEQSQMAALEAMGCEMGQGFLLGKPSPAEVIKSLLGPRAARRAVGSRAV